MAGLIDRLRKHIGTVLARPEEDEKSIVSDAQIAFGVLLWVVAEADEKFLPVEQEEIKNVLQKMDGLETQDIDRILAVVAQTAKDRVDVYAFTSELNEVLSRQEKMVLMAQLFRVACADGDLDERENGTIRQINGLLRLDHADYVEAKIKVKKELGWDTAGL